MIIRSTAKKYLVALAALVSISLFIPFLIHAQTTSPNTLAATIRAAIMKDPRSANLSPAQVDTIVNALSVKAQTQGLTAQNIAYRAGTVGISVPATVSNTPVTVDPCALSSWCTAGKAIGSGLVRNAIIAAFWILAFLLIIIVWHMRKHPHLNGSLDTPEPPAIGGVI